MKTVFVTRHRGAIEWAEKAGLIAEQIAHLEIGAIGQGDTVIGTLPVHIAAEVCEAGARYVHLALNVPAEARGRDLTSEEMDVFGANLEEFVVTRKAK